MNKTVFLYWCFSFNLKYYLILGNTNNLLHSLIKKILCFLWSLTQVKRSCNNINNSRMQVIDYIFSCDYGQTKDILVDNIFGVFEKKKKGLSKTSSKEVICQNARI